MLWCLESRISLSLLTAQTFWRTTEVLGLENAGTTGSTGATGASGATGGTGFTGAIA